MHPCCMRGLLAGSTPQLFLAPVPRHIQGTRDNQAPNGGGRLPQNNRLLYKRGFPLCLHYSINGTVCQVFNDINGLYDTQAA
jgi:hypothetical protein